MSACFLGPFYVMMAPQDVLQSTGLGQRTLVPRSGIVPKLEPGNRVSRDDRRRATHNEGLSISEAVDLWSPVCSWTRNHSCSWNGRESFGVPFVIALYGLCEVTEVWNRPDPGWLSGEQGEITGLLVQYWKLSLHSVLCTHIMSSSYRSNRFAFVSVGSLHCA